MKVAKNEIREKFILAQLTLCPNEASYTAAGCWRSLSCSYVDESWTTEDLRIMTSIRLKISGAADNEHGEKLIADFAD